MVASFLRNGSYDLTTCVNKKWDDFNPANQRKVSVLLNPRTSPLFVINFLQVYFDFEFNMLFNLFKNICPCIWEVPSTVSSASRVL